jgi:hypothetical protein
MARIIEGKFAEGIGVAKPQALILLLLMASAQPLVAQTLYRCGNTYQDKPCSGQNGKVVTVLKSGEAGPGLVDAKCSQRGNEAQKLMWARETGAIESDMVAKARTASERELVAVVYRQNGSSAQVRQAVEAACIAEKEKAGTMGLPLGMGAASAASGASANASAAATNKPNCEKLRSEVNAMLGKEAGKEQREAVTAALKGAGC